MKRFLTVKSFQTIKRKLNRFITGVAGRKKMTALELGHKRRKCEKIVMVTAYDYPSALALDRAGVDVILVGDSVGMVELGYDTTQPVTLEQMHHHCKAVSRGARFPLLVGDMPFGSYEINDEEALRNAFVYLKHCGMDAVKLEGGFEVVSTVKKIVSGGVAVMGHIGLTPQKLSVLGGFRAQGRTATKARKLVDEALALQDAGCFALVIECVPSEVAQAVTEAIEIPTIGIGSGGETSGQVLVYHDLLGMLNHPHHSVFVPKFCKQYTDLGSQIENALKEFSNEVKTGAFPSKEFSPYKMTKAESKKFKELMGKDEGERNIQKQEMTTKLQEQDEYSVLNLYGGSGPNDTSQK